ncbi:DinB family protein [Paenibacillus sp. Z6-24]
MLHPNTIKVREQIWDFADSLDESILNEHARPDQWTIAQVMEHLYLMETAITDRLIQTLQQNEPTPAPISGATSTPSFHLTLDRSRHTPAPPELVPADKHLTLTELRTRLDRSRSRLEETIAAASSEDLRGKTMNHPIFGPLTLEEWHEFVGLHEQRHLEQMKEIQAALGSTG